MYKQFKDVRAWYSRKKSNGNIPKYYDEVTDILNKFQENDLMDADFFTWKLLNDYLYWHNYGVAMKSQTKKVVEALLKYGENSLFWEELERTRHARKLDLIRVTYLAHVVLTAEGKIPKKAGFFRMMALDFRRKLKLYPLTEKQRCFLWEVERLMGVYYEDLSPEENGEIWRLQAVQKEKEKNDA